jgi:hypothetical protein
MHGHRYSCKGACQGERDDLAYSLCQLAWYRDWYSANDDDALARGSRRGAGG